MLVWTSAVNVPRELGQRHIPKRFGFTERSYYSRCEMTWFNLSEFWPHRSKFSKEDISCATTLQWLLKTLPLNEHCHSSHIFCQPLLFSRCFFFFFNDFSAGILFWLPVTQRDAIRATKRRGENKAGRASKQGSELSTQYEAIKLQHFMIDKYCAADLFQMNNTLTPAKRSPGMTGSVFFS